MSACNRILNFLDTLQEQPVKIDIRKELAFIEFMGVNDARDTETIARHFYALGQQSKEQPVCEGEEEEYEQIKQKVCSECPSHKDDYCGYVKRQLQRKCNYLSDVMYGYELGRQSKPKVSEELETEANKYAEDNTWVNEFTNDGEIPEWYKHTAEVFKAGASWQKEQDEKELSEKIASAYQLGLADKEKQLMKEAVEGIVTTRSMAGNIVTAHIDHQFKDGQKVKIIIVKED